MHIAVLHKINDRFLKDLGGLHACDACAAIIKLVRLNKVVLYIGLTNANSIVPHVVCMQVIYKTNCELIEQVETIYRRVFYN